MERCCSVPGRQQAVRRQTFLRIRPAATEIGYASWYGNPYHGRRAANGEVYDMNKMTAAHRTLPFDTMVKVFNLENQRATIVRITDRGPFIQGRIIDLSLAAAKQISLVGPGTAMVRLEIVSTNGGRQADSFAVQVGAFSKLASAEGLRDRLGGQFRNVFIENFLVDGTMFFRVRIGPQSSREEARKMAALVKRKNLPSMIVRLDTR